MSQSLKACFRVLEEGRFIIINVSPVITKRAGREFESVRYPIHFDFHQILIDNGFYFVIVWVKVCWFIVKKPLFYIDKNIKIAEKRLKPIKQNHTLFGKKNCL